MPIIISYNDLTASAGPVKHCLAYDIRWEISRIWWSGLDRYEKEQVIIFDGSGTGIGSTEKKYLGGSLMLFWIKPKTVDRSPKRDGGEQTPSARRICQKPKIRRFRRKLFNAFRQDFRDGLAKLLEKGRMRRLSLTWTEGPAGNLCNKEQVFVSVLVPVFFHCKATMTVWLVPLLLTELLLIYVMGRVSKGIKNRELRDAYVELGQTQRRLEIALSAAQKAAAVDDLTGMMNFKSFRKEISMALEDMEEDESGILVMIDGDHFKSINDNYGHSVGDEVIKLTAQMIIGRIRTVDLASRLHGDEFAIFVANTSDHSVAKRIMEDINNTLGKEAKRRNMPSITLSASAVIAKHGDTYISLAKAADEALYKAKVTHNGGFAYQ